MTIDSEALLAKATWFRRCPNTGEYSGEYCSVRPYDDSNMVPMISVDTALSALDQPAQEPVYHIYKAPDGHIEYGAKPLTADDKRNGWTETPLYAAPQPTKIPYSKDAQNAVMTLLEQGKVYVDNQGCLSLIKGDVDVVMDATHPKA